jgi:HAD superfamily hydrolase (TIGR01509 family)
MARVITGVMFDFSQTLFRSESTGPWLDAGLARMGLELPAAERDALAERLLENGAMPGGPEPRRLTAEQQAQWDRRDLDAESHRSAYEGLTHASDLPDPALARILYDRHMEPEAWRPYLDAEATLTELRGRGVPVAVVSNIGWDMRPIFERFGFDRLIDVFVLSYEHGVQKPDPALFRVALDALGMSGPQTVMVGDNPRADGGATALGCAFHHVAPIPIEERPDALAAVLAMLG